jgi:sugar phosphate isomerase/epimerase
MKQFLVLILFMSSFLSMTAQQLHIKYYCTNWGNSDSWDAFCLRVKNAGYDGVELIICSPNERKEMIDALHKYGLSLGLLSGGSGGTYEEYKQSFKRNLDEAAQLKPDYINCHTGKDYYSFEQNKTLIELADAAKNKYHIPVYHETHRGRFSFAAHVTKEYLEKIPTLQLALDIPALVQCARINASDQPEAVTKALSRTEHIHARIGHPEGPQVNDLRLLNGRVSLHNI